MIGQANAAAQFHLHQMSMMQQRQLMPGGFGMLGGTPGFGPVGLDTYGGSMFGMNPMMSSGFPSAAWG